jgi:hypothetical protein
MITALKETKGMVYLAARQLGCSHQTVYNYIKRHPTVEEAWKAEHGTVGDNAELALYSAILKGEHWAVTFYLRTKGKDRGYTERTEQEITGAGGGPIEQRLVILPAKEDE